LLLGLDLAVAAGEAVAVIGRSGSGKSTLLRLIAGMTNLRAGKVEVGGRELSNLTYAELQAHRCATGVSFATAGLLANKTIGDNIMLPFEYHTVPEPSVEAVSARLRAIADELQLLDDLREPAPRASAAVRKRAMIARALVLEPALLLLDEPDLGLTVSEAVPVVAAIERRRRERGLTVVMTMHHPHHEPYVVDRVLRLEHGTLAR